MTEQWLSIVEYARTYQVSDMTVRRRIKTGKLHAILQDGKYFIPVAPNGSVSGEGAKAQARHAAASLQASSNPGSSFAPPAALPQQNYQAHGHGQSQPAPSYGHQAVKRPQHHDISVHSGKGHHGSSHAFQAPKPQPYRLTPNDSEPDVGLIPQSLRRPFTDDANALVDSRALLAYCEASLRKIAEGERRTVEKFKGKLEALEAVLGQRDLELATLRQQVEDLQLLVKILEKRK